MKKIITTIVCAFLLLFGLASCTNSLSAGSISSKLKDSGYTVSNYTPQEYEAEQQGAIEATKVTGLTTVIVAYKSDTALIVFVLDSTEHASNVMSNSEYLGLLSRFGDKYCDEGQTSKMGSHNNVVWAGSAKARDAAGINIGV